MISVLLNPNCLYNIKEIVITDTIALSEEKKAGTDKIKVVSIADMIAETIDSIENHTPVSHVYEQFSYDSYK